MNQTESNIAESTYNKSYKKILLLLSFLLGSSLLLFAVYGFIKESKEILSKGKDFFAQEMIIRIAGGLIISLVTALPYFIGGILIEQTKKPLYLFSISIILFVVNIILILNVLLFPKSSTDSIALIFFPFYFLILVLLSWAVLKILERFSNR